jgi:hypothetical protein
MKKALTALAVAGILSVTTGKGTTAGALDDQPAVRLGSFSATPHQMAATSDVAVPMTRELATPASQNAAVAPENRVAPGLYKDYPPTVHQASLGLRQAPQRVDPGGR